MGNTDQKYNNKNFINIKLNLENIVLKSKNFKDYYS